MRPTIQTSSGNYFDFINPEQSRFTIEDIAHALANICRFTGHVKWFYSVAQHSVIVSHDLPTKQLQLYGLLHDAAEAFLGDVSSPLKQLLPDYKAIEERVEHAVLKRFGLPSPMPPEIKASDLRALMTEKRDLLPGDVGDKVHWYADVKPMHLRIYPWQPAYAERRFLKRYEELV